MDPKCETELQKCHFIDQIDTNKKTWINRINTIINTICL